MRQTISNQMVEKSMLPNIYKIPDSVSKIFSAFLEFSAGALAQRIGHDGGEALSV